LSNADSPYIPEVASEVKSSRFVWLGHMGKKIPLSMNGLEKRLDYIRVFKLNLTGYVNNLIPYRIEVYKLVRRIGGKRSVKPTIVDNFCPTPNNSVN
jgi:hypothetical protein